jgi:hypothetical protein
MQRRCPRGQGATRGPDRLKRIPCGMKNEAGDVNKLLESTSIILQPRDAPSKRGDDRGVRTRQLHSGVTLIPLHTCCQQHEGTSGPDDPWPYTLARWSGHGPFLEVRSLSESDLAINMHGTRRDQYVHACIVETLVNV